MVDTVTASDGHTTGELSAAHQQMEGRTSPFKHDPFACAFAVSESGKSNGIGTRRGQLTLACGSFPFIRDAGCI